jgi:hypothetical protein
MNTNFGGNPAQTDLTQQPWFDLIADSFGRWADLGGVTYVYEQEDDGVLQPNLNGQLGVRGDIRIGGYNVDGASGTLAFTYLPTAGSDMVFDTGDAAFFANAANSHRNFRDTAMHEIGHSFGLLHVESTSNLLMEPVINTSFDGPQLDEARGVQFFFGDVNEKANGGQGNDSAALASNLGTIFAGATKTIGAAANVSGQAISAIATDFVSISNLGDADFISFTVSQPSLLSAMLTPRGGVFTQASEGQTLTSFNANARNNLALAVLGTNGTSILAATNTNPAGAAESLIDILLPTTGKYFARITGADDTIQLYELSLSIDALQPGDFNNDGIVDAADYVRWRKNTANSSLPNDNGLTNQAARFNLWRAHFRNTAGSGTFATGAVPEPAGLAILLTGAAAIFTLRRAVTS